MEFSPEQLGELRTMLNSVNVTDDHISRGVRLTEKGTQTVAKKFGIQPVEVVEMLAALAASTADDLSEEDERFSYEADYMGNITLRDSETGREIFLQGDEAFAVADKLTAHPDKEAIIISQYFDVTPINESVETTATKEGGTFNFPYRGKFATARYWLDETNKFQLRVISLRDGEDNEENITPELQTKLDAIAMTWVDKV